jgi:hypothetical protein
MVPTKTVLSCSTIPRAGDSLETTSIVLIPGLYQHRLSRFRTFSQGEPRVR